MKKRSLIIMALVGVMMASCACGKTEATTEATTEAKKATAEDATKATTTEAEKTASETEATADDVIEVEESADDIGSEMSSEEKRSIAETLIGKSGDELYAAIGTCISIHPVADADENGVYHGYLHYGDFEVEIESPDYVFVETGDVSACTVVAVLDKQFDK